MKVHPEMLLKTRSGFRHHATHPEMSMKTKGFILLASILLKINEIHSDLSPEIAALLPRLPIRRYLAKQKRRRAPPRYSTSKMSYPSTTLMRYTFGGALLPTSIWGARDAQKILKSWIAYAPRERMECYAQENRSAQ